MTSPQGKKNAAAMISLKKVLSLSALSICVFSITLSAEDAKRAKTLDRFERIDTKTVNPGHCKIKILTLPEPEHHRALQIIADFALANTVYAVSKTFPTGTVNPKKYKGFRFWARTQSGTSMYCTVGRANQRKDDRLNWFGSPGFKVSENWTEYFIPFTAFKRAGATVWRDNHQVQIPGGDPIEPDEYEDLNRFSFEFSIHGRGTETTSHVIVDGLELVEN